MRACICAGPRTTRSMPCSSPPARRRSSSRRSSQIRGWPSWRDHLTFVEQIEEDIARLKTRLEHVDEPRLRRIVMADIARLKARRAAELLRIVASLRAHDDLARRLDLVLSVPGIGERTALALIIRMPELGRISREQAAALAGLAPFDDDSGTHKGQRHIAGGRGRLRRSLFAAALPAAFRWNKALIDLYARLTARGKAHNAALVACARKLLIYANTVVAARNPVDRTARRDLMVATIALFLTLLALILPRGGLKHHNRTRNPHAPSICPCHMCACALGRAARRGADTYSAADHAVAVRVRCRSCRRRSRPTCASSGR